MVTITSSAIKNIFKNLHELITLINYTNGKQIVETLMASPIIDQIKNWYIKTEWLRLQHYYHRMPKQTIACWPFTLFPQTKTHLIIIFLLWQHIRSFLPLSLTHTHTHTHQLKWLATAASDFCAVWHSFCLVIHNLIIIATCGWG